MRQCAAGRVPWRRAVLLPALLGRRLLLAGQHHSGPRYARPAQRHVAGAVNSLFLFPLPLGYLGLFRGQVAGAVALFFSSLFLILPWGWVAGYLRLFLGTLAIILVLYVLLFGRCARARNPESESLLLYQKNVEKTSHAVQTCV